MNLQAKLEEAIKQSANIPGWLWPRESAEIFYRTLNSTLHVEIGSFCGKSLYVTAAAMDGGKIIAVDPLESSDSYTRVEKVPDIKWNKEVFNCTIDAIHRNFKTKIEWWDISSIAAIQKCMQLGLKFDSCFIDAGHNLFECEADLLGWSALVKQGGILFGHDYYPNNMGVVTAVNKSFGNNFDVIKDTRIWEHKK